MKRSFWGICWLGLIACLLGATPLAQAATCPADNPLSTPSADFTDHGDGIVTHNKTGLIWAKCSQGQTYGSGTCTGSATGMIWSAALTAAKNATLAGFTDWRLPSKEELESLVETGCYSPSIHDTRFPATPNGYYWTSTTYQAAPTQAWLVHFADGNSYVSYKAGNVVVRLVRGGQSFDALSPQPSKLAITSVHGGANPAFGTPFNVAIQAQDNTGTPATLSAATLVQLSVQTGTGSLGATTSCTIPAAANTCTVVGMTYSKAETGVVLRASVSSGQSLTAGDSAAFDVLPIPVTVSLGNLSPYTYDGSQQSATCSTSPNVSYSLTYSDIGSGTGRVNAGSYGVNCAVTDPNYTGSASGTLTILFRLAPNVVVGDTGTVSATGGASGNPVTFASTTPSACTVTGSTVTGVAAGSNNCILAADQAGNATRRGLFPRAVRLRRHRLYPGLDPELHPHLSPGVAVRHRVLEVRSHRGQHPPALVPLERSGERPLDLGPSGEFHHHRRRAGRQRPHS
jgi:hypothetical protein